MADLVPDDLIETIAVVGEPHEIAAKLTRDSPGSRIRWRS